MKRKAKRPLVKLSVYKQAVSEAGIMKERVSLKIHFVCAMGERQRADALNGYRLTAVWQLLINLQFLIRSHP